MNKRIKCKDWTLGKNRTTMKIEVPEALLKKLREAEEHSPCSINQIFIDGAFAHVEELMKTEWVKE